MGLRLRFSVLWPRFKNAASEPFFFSGFESFDFTMPSDIGSFGSYTFCQQPLGALKMTVVNYDFSPFHLIVMVKRPRIKEERWSILRKVVNEAVEICYTENLYLFISSLLCSLFS